MNSIEDSPEPERADRYLFLAFLLILFWIPLPVASNHLWAWSFFEACVLSLAICWLVLFARGRVSTTPAFRRAWPALLLFTTVFAWTMFQLAPLPDSLIAVLSPNGADVYSQMSSGNTLSLDPSGTRAAALKTLSYGVLFTLTLLLVNRRDRLRFLALVLVFSGAFQAAFGVFMTLSGFEYGFFIKKVHNIGVVTGTFVNANHLAAYLEMCMALGVGLLLVIMVRTSVIPARKFLSRLLDMMRGNKAKVGIALLIMLVGLVLSKSRMGNIAFFSSLLIAIVYYVLVVRRVSLVVLAFFFVVFLIDILMIGNIFHIGKLGNEVRQTTVATDVSRVHVGRDTMEMAIDYPITGTGAGSFASTYPMYDSGKIGSWHYKYAHNDYLQFASEFGLPGLAILAAIVLLSLWHAARAQFERHDRLMSGLGCGVLMAIVAMLIHTAVDFNLQIPANAATFVVILAMGWHTRWTPSS